MSRVAHKIKYEFSLTEHDTNGAKYRRRKYYYVCGKIEESIIEAELEQPDVEGWPEGTRLCKKCEAEMKRIKK